MDYGKLIDIASKVSLAVVLMVILVGGVLGYWVSGPTYRDAVSERNEWKSLALKGTKIAEQVSRTSITGPADVPHPLPTNPTPAQVDSKLETLRKKSAYVTEPTDTPLP